MIYHLCSSQDSITEDEDEIYIEEFDDDEDETDDSGIIIEEADVG